ncbi:MAG TPA: 3-phosphoshikimate 1-carboxyvinyltransferase [Aquihabitans sp.]|nr:3-phosphoshikimate 1-carboxyvinyltransferase [Aquihabitans sp.]
MTGPAELRALADPYPVDPIVGPLDATVVVPGSKSITNRALVCAALADGTSRLEGALVADDTEAMVGVLRALGLEVDVDAQGAPGGVGPAIEVVGCAGALPGTDALLDVRQSGTTARFLLPLLSLGHGAYRVTAHPQMQARPMGETFTALRSLGSGIEEQGATGSLPATVSGGARSGVVRLAGDVSSQFLSGLLLSGPCRPDGLVVELTTELVSRPYVELTIAVMGAFGASVDQLDERTFAVAPGGYRATTHRVEPDASAASYPLAAAAVCGGQVTVAGLGPDALQGDARFADVLALMGASVRRDEVGTTVAFEAGGPLHGGDFDFTHISDTAQTAAVLAPFADRPVRIGGIGFIRRKEIDRVAAVATELHRAGVRVEVDDDGWTIHPGPVRPATFETYEDHRMAMSFALLGLRAAGVAIAGPGCVAKTFPGYWAMLEGLRSSTGGR